MNILHDTRINYLGFVLALSLTACAGVEVQKPEATTPMLSMYKNKYSGAQSFISRSESSDKVSKLFPGVSEEALWQAILIVLAQETAILHVSRSEHTVVALPDRIAPLLSVSLTQDDNLPDHRTVSIDWYDSAYENDADSLALMEDQGYKISATPEFKDLDVISDGILGAIATQAVGASSWPFLE